MILWLIVVALLKLLKRRWCLGAQAVAEMNSKMVEALKGLTSGCWRWATRKPRR